MIGRRVEELFWNFTAPFGVIKRMISCSLIHTDTHTHKRDKTEPRRRKTFAAAIKKVFLSAQKEHGKQSCPPAVGERSHLYAKSRRQGSIHLKIVFSTLKIFFLNKLFQNQLLPYARPAAQVDSGRNYHSTSEERESRWCSWAKTYPKLLFAFEFSVKQLSRLWLWQQRAHRAVSGSLSAMRKVGLVIYCRERVASYRFH